jgi:Mlc titration factor MtfA (ptsG expression regulator)
MGAASARAAHLAWSTTLQTEFEKFCDQISLAERFGAEPPWLDSYAATALDEFFAVTCEAYFVNCKQFSLEFPALLPMYDAFFNASPQPAN